LNQPRNRSSEVLDHLAGFYEIAMRDQKSGLMSISFWLTKPMGNVQVPTDGILITAILGNEKKVLFPERLDTHESGTKRDNCPYRLGMRLKYDALPEDWVGKCEISFGRSYRCFPFTGVVDISGSLRPESVRPPAAQLQEAAAP
jgi:hypothetical protein